MVALAEQKTVNAVHGGGVTPGVQLCQAHYILRPVLIPPVAQSDLLRQAVRLDPPEGLQVGVEEVQPGEGDLQEDGSDVADCHVVRESDGVASLTETGGHLTNPLRQRSGETEPSTSSAEVEADISVVSLVVDLERLGDGDLAQVPVLV